jgi:hypothetical protein
MLHTILTPNRQGWLSTIENNKATSVSIYPNPASDLITIVLMESQVVDVNLISLEGKKNYSFIFGDTIGSATLYSIFTCRNIHPTVPAKRSTSSCTFGKAIIKNRIQSLTTSERPKALVNTLMINS